MTYRASFKFAGLLVALAMTACGGSGGDSSTPAPATPAVPEQPTTPAIPATPTPVSSDRIEPLDTGLPKSASSASAKVAAASGAAVQATPVRLGPLEGAQALVKKATQPAAITKGAPQQIGVARPVAATAKARDLMGQLKWQPAGAGLQRAAVSFTAEGALGVRLGLVVRQLPAGTVLRFYAQAGGDPVQVSGADVLRSIQRNLDAGDTGDSARTYWGPEFGGAETTLELEVPVAARLEQELDIAVPTLSHFFVSPDQATAASFAKGVGDSGTCNIDVSCKPELGAESRSVARMVFVIDGGSFLCTGTLLNDATSSKKPHFLSAHHCISTQTVASSLTTDWFFRSSACNNATVNPATQKVTGGAELLFADSQTDTSFMRLNSAPPQGVVYAGSYVGSVNTSAAVVGIHHPRGDLQKTSAGSVAQFSYCSNEQCFPETQQNSKFYTVGWTEGTTEGGSSGSGLFFTIGSTRYLVGQLYGGSSSCEAPTGRDHYGRFDLPFKLALKAWLMPGT